MQGRLQRFGRLDVDAERRYYRQRRYGRSRVLAGMADAPGEPGGPQWPAAVAGADRGCREAGFDERQTRAGPAVRELLEPHRCERARQRALFGMKAHEVRIGVRELGDDAGREQGCRPGRVAGCGYFHSAGSGVGCEFQLNSIIPQ